MILRNRAAPADPARHLRIVENRGKIESSRLPMIVRGLGFQHVYPTDHFIHRAKTEVRHPGAHFLGYIKEEIDDVFRSTLKFLAQLWILCGNSHRTGV